MSVKRLRKEAEKLVDSEDLDELGLGIEPDEDDMKKWEVTIVDPKIPPTMRGCSTSGLTFRTNIPTSPPKLRLRLRFTIPIYPKARGRSARPSLKIRVDSSKGRKGRPDDSFVNTEKSRRRQYAD